MDLNLENTYKMMSIGFTQEEININNIKLFDNVFDNSDIADFNELELSERAASKSGHYV